MQQESFIKTYFNFKRIGCNYLITNDLGKFDVLKPDEFEDFITGNIGNNAYLYQRLIKNYFLVPEGQREIQLSNMALILRQAKNYLFESTQLHIFILTIRCNQSCIYCQASIKGTSYQKGNMTVEIAQKAVDIALSSPSKNLTFEFQGGEPLLNFDTLRFIVEYGSTKAKALGKKLTFNLVSNLTLLTDEILKFLIENNVSICTSLDGPQSVHNFNRPLLGSDSYLEVKNAINRINKEYQNQGLTNKVQALLTITKNSLQYGEEIVDEYLKMGFGDIFIRPLTPLGFAAKNWDKVGYSSEEFLSFYDRCLNHIIQKFVNGVPIMEGQARLFLRKINSQGINYMELRSPCGGALGQLAYNYDGKVYVCDEARMLAETGLDSFQCGSVFKNDYIDLVDNSVARSVCTASCLESIPGCSECAYNPYCGTCPVLNLKESNSIFPKTPESYKCKINKGILDIIFNKMANGTSSIRDVLDSWSN